MSTTYSASDVTPEGASAGAEHYAPEVEKPVAPEMPLVSDSYRRYALWILMLICVMNFLDRQIIGILAEPIKQDLGLKDWQIGLMTGLAFALFYTGMAIPIARYAERGNRALIISGAVAVWSFFTLISGFAQNFVQLVLARIGVGVGEAGCLPPAHSLITDYTPKEKRASALAFYSMGTPIGALLGMALGGVIADAYGWRTALLVAGVPGLVLAAIAAVTLIEPRKKFKQAIAIQQSAAPKFKDAWAEIKSKKTFWLISGAVSALAFKSYGSGIFIAPFFLRNHGAQLTEIANGFGLGLMGFIGISLGVFTGFTGVLGVWLGGQLADRYVKKDVRHFMTIPAVAGFASVPFTLAALWVDNAIVALILMMLPSLLNQTWYGPASAAIQGLVQPHTRATASAIFIFVVNIIGLGLGPLFVGMVSDYANTGLGMGEAGGVRAALLVAALLGFLSAALFLKARRHIKDELVS